MKLTDKEQLLFNALKKEKPTVSLDRLLEIFRVGDSEKARKGMNQKVKYLGAKIAGTGWIIQRTTPIGRGNKAEYKMTKKF